MVTTSSYTTQQYHVILLITLWSRVHMCLAVKILLPEIVVYTQAQGIMATCSNSTVTNFNGVYACVLPNNSY